MRTNPHYGMAPSGKLFERETPQEMHRRIVWGNTPCTLCGNGPIALEARIYLPQDVIRRQDPLGLILGNYGGPVRTFNHAKMGAKYHFIRSIFGCIRCQKPTELLVAEEQRKLSSAAYVQWDRGVAVQKIVSMARKSFEREYLGNFESRV